MGYYLQFVFTWALPSGRRPRWKAAESRIRQIPVRSYDGYHQEAETDSELHEALNRDLARVREAMAEDRLVTALRIGGSRLWVLAATVFSTSDETEYDDLWEAVREVFNAGALEAAGFETATNVSLNG